MNRSARRILLAVQPGVLEGALATLLSGDSEDEVVQLSRTGQRSIWGDYDAAVVSDQLPAGVRAHVVITLPDTRGSSGTGTITRGELVHEVSISGAERVIDLLEEYAPRPQVQWR